MDQELVKIGSSVLGKAYDDLVHPVAVPLGKVAGFLPRTICVWLQGWERWIINGEESVKRTVEVVGERAGEIPEEHLVEPPAHVAVPAIQQLAYCYDSDSLREMYANLLLSSMDDRTAEYVHPSFVQILKEISPDEAKLLGTLVSKGPDDRIAIPLLDLRIVPTDQLVPYRWNEILCGYNECGVGVCERPEQSLVYLGNLERLGILKRCDTYTEDIEEKLKTFETSEAISTAREKNPLEEGYRYDFRRWSYQVTDFGSNFIRTCVRGGQRPDQSPTE